MRLQEAIDDMRALHGDAGVTAFLQAIGETDYDSDKLIRYSSVLVDDLNDQYLEENLLW
jgi:hypothetical protein